MVFIMCTSDHLISDMTHRGEGKKLWLGAEANNASALYLEGENNRVVLHRATNKESEVYRPADLPTDL